MNQEPDLDRLADHLAAVEEAEGKRPRHSSEPDDPEITKQLGDFVDDLRRLLRYHGLDDHVGVPDFILAEHLVNHLDCLKETNDAVKRHDEK